MLSSCSPTNAVAGPTLNPPTEIPATKTIEPTQIPTVIPSPTPLPGDLVLPLDTLDDQIPWLPMENSARPGTAMYIFNQEKPPFNSVLVRQAFAAAIDREALVEIASKFGAIDPRAATSLTPPETLGRDLYNTVGIPFDPDQAKAYLAEAGYTDPTKFPDVTILINIGGDAAPGFHVRITDAMIDMWKEYLGVTVTSEVVDWGTYQDRIVSNPPEIVRMSWAADLNDPDNFLRELYYSDSQYNYAHFSNPEYDQLVDQAAENQSPAERQELYIQAERILCESEAVIIPLYHSKWNIP